MKYLPHEKLIIEWASDESSFQLLLPWLTMIIDVEPAEKPWIKDATENLHSNPISPNVQRFIKELKDYPIFYIQPRSAEEFKNQDLQSCPPLEIVDSSTPTRLLETIGLKEIDPNLKKNLFSSWTWDHEKILSKARIEGTDLYDPVSFITYLICYRLEWESDTWSGQDGLGQTLERYLKEDEQKFFRAIGWISRQSWFVTMTSIKMMEPALTYFSKAKDLIEHFIADETGHYKFMEQVFEDIELNKNDFMVSEGTKWLLAVHGRTATISPLAFSALINLFEAAFYEGQDPISRVIKMSSRPHAARGYDLHYKINQEHRHCDMPVILAQRLAPQTREHAELTLGIFEFTLNTLDNMEKNLESYLPLQVAA